MLHYNPRHVSSSTIFIFRRSNCIITAPGIVTLEISGGYYIKNEVCFIVKRVVKYKCCDSSEVNPNAH